MNDKSNKNKDKYNIRWEINSLNASSATDLTGLIPRAPVTDDELDSYSELMSYRPEDIVVEGKAANQNQSLKLTKDRNAFSSKQS